jgi:hypothetical protein
MRRPGLTVVPAIALLVTGCLGASSVSQTTAVHLPVTRGVIVTVGGPAPGLPAPVRGATFKLLGGDRTVLVRANDRGQFSFVAAPGRYKVVMTAHAPMVNGRFMQPRPSSITVSAEPKLVRLVFQLP